MARKLVAGYAIVRVPYQFGYLIAYDAAIRLGQEIVWQECRPHDRLCTTSGGATQRAKAALRKVAA